MMITGPTVKPFTLPKAHLMLDSSHSRYVAHKVQFSSQLSTP